MESESRMQLDKEMTSLMPEATACAGIHHIVHNLSKNVCVLCHADLSGMLALKLYALSSTSLSTASASFEHVCTTLSTLLT